jgi:hypothetical protein
MARLRRRLLCLGATDGVIRSDGDHQWLTFKDPPCPRMPPVPRTAARPRRP